MGAETYHFGNKKQISALIEKTIEQTQEIRNSNDLKRTEIRNGMSGVLSALQNQSNITSFQTLYANNIQASLTINYTFLSYMYKTHGLIQTAIDVPVLDALGDGIIIKSVELDDDDIKYLDDEIMENAVLDGLIETKCWARLFGGAALVINNGEDPATPLTENSKMHYLKLYPADRWELGSAQRLSDNSIVNTNSPWETKASLNADFYLFYGERYHKSRVLTMTGKMGPHMIRWQLQGWGMSEVERMVEDFNLYLRTREVLFDLLNEAKVDVFSVEGLREAVSQPGGDQAIAQRFALVQKLKNFNNALIMDKQDEYTQKVMTYSGIAEVMEDNRTGIACALRMPKTKLFGTESKGLNATTDDLEIYNSMIRSQIRRPMIKPIREVIKLLMRYLFNNQTYDFSFEYMPLREMTAKDEEEVKKSKSDRIMSRYDRGLMDSEETGLADRKGKLIDIDTKAAQGLLDEFPEAPAMAQMQENEKGSNENGNE